MSRGKRYEEKKLNKKKVFAVILAIIVVIMSVLIIRDALTGDVTRTRTSGKSYFSAYKNNKWGVIDENGDIVIEPSYEEMIIIPDNQTDVFLCTYDVNYDTGEYSTKALNSDNEEIFTKYTKVEAISNYDENNNLWYEDNVLKVEQDGKWGTINLKGKTALDTEYDSIEAMPGIEDTLLIEKDGLYGIADNDGSIIVDVQYTEITNLGETNKDGFIVCDESGLYGIVDSSKNVILENKYQEIQKVYGNDLYVVTEDGSQKVVNSNGEDILTQGFDQITAILSAEDEGVIYVSNGQYGIMNLSGEILIQAQYDNLIEVKENIFIATSGSTKGVIDINNTELIPFDYESITYNETAKIYIAEDENYQNYIINDNYEVQQTGILIEINTDEGYFELRQDDEYKYYDFNFEEKTKVEVLSDNTLFLDKKDNLYGYVDKDGNVVVEYMYDDATEQNEYGFAAVKKDGKWGAINSKGEVVQEPTYDLEDYLWIDFIGQWHLGKDINMNYYNQE